MKDDEINMLAVSIKEKGLLLPILIKELEGGQIIIVSGDGSAHWGHERLVGDRVLPAS